MKWRASRLMLKNLTPNPFPRGKGNQIVGSNLFPRGKGNRIFWPLSHPEPESEMSSSTFRDFL
jgi:hypothetical protein